MTNRKAKLMESIRIVTAIAGKDALDALKNRTILSLILGMVFTMFSTQALPFLLKLSQVPWVIVYDAGDSRLVAELAQSEQYRLTEADSLQEMENWLVDTSAEALALVLPADFDRVLDAGGVPEIEGYVMWAHRSAAGEPRLKLEQHLQELLGQPVRIHVEGNVLYPPLKGTGGLGMVATVMVLIIMIIGAFLVPYLIFEEKQAHTMEALLVSPASTGQIIGGKILAGLVYSLSTMAVVLAFNYRTVVHWDIALAASISGAILFIAVGLVLGTIFESPQQMGLWAGVPVLLLLIPLMMSTLNASLPDALAALFPWLPTVALGRAFVLSFSGAATLTRALPELAIVLGWAVPFYAITIWQLRRSDR